MLDLGVDENYVRHELSKLNLNSEYELHVKKDTKTGICGTRVDIVLKDVMHHHQSHNDIITTSATRASTAMKTTLMTTTLIMLNNRSALTWKKVLPSMPIGK